MGLNITIVGAHPDDIEMGFGASVSLFISKGHNVTMLDLTNGEPTPFGSPEKRAVELAEAAKILGIKNRITLDLKNRELVDDIASRHKVAAVYRQTRPDVLFVQGPVDAHPDHLAANSLAIKARFDAKLTKSTIPGEPWWPRKLFKYDASHLRLIQKPSFILDVSTNFEIKLEAIRAYKSQFHDAGREDEIIDRIRDKGAYFGGLIGAKYGEPVFCDAEIGLADIGAVLF
jgi:bacillithiol biosynthesis deacetylase BshB1